MRKTITLLLAVIILVSLLTACSKTVPEPPQKLETATDALTNSAGTYGNTRTIYTAGYAYLCETTYTLSTDGLVNAASTVYYLDGTEKQSAVLAELQSKHNFTISVKNGITSEVEWSQAEIDEVFADMDATATAKYLDDLQNSAGVGALSVLPLSGTIYDDGELEITLETVYVQNGRYAMFVVSMKNASMSEKSVSMLSCMMDNCFIEMDGSSRVTVGSYESVETVFYSSESSIPAFEWCCLEDTASISMKLSIESDSGVSVYTADASTNNQNSFELPDGEVLYEDFSMRVTLLDWNDSMGIGTIAVERLNEAQWDSLSMDAVYDGCRAKASRSLELKNGGDFSIIKLSPANDCGEVFAMTKASGVELYFIPSNSQKLLGCVSCTVGQPAVTQLNHGSATWQKTEYSIVNLGWKDDYINGARVLLLLVRNDTDELVYFIPRNDLIVVNKENTPAMTFYPAVTPNSYSVVALMPLTDKDFINLKINLGIYHIENGAHVLITETGNIKVK